MTDGDELSCRSQQAECRVSRHIVRQRHDELERIQAVTELCSPVTDRQIDRQSTEGTTDLRESKETWS